MPDDVRDLPVEILKQIRDELREHGKELREHRTLLTQHGEHLSRIQAELSGHRAETRRELMAIKARLPVSEDIAERLSAVEARLDRLEEQSRRS